MFLTGCDRFHMINSGSRGLRFGSRTVLFLPRRDIRMQTPPPSPSDWDEYAWENLESIRGRKRMRKLLPLIPRAGRHLDIGTGRGDGTAVVQAVKPTAAIEYGWKSLSIARERVRQIVQASGTAIPFRSESFCSVTLLDVIEHVPDYRSLVAEIHRVLEPGGRFVLQAPTIESMRIKQIGIRIYRILRLPVRAWRFGRAVLAKLLRRPPPVSPSVKPQPYDKELTRRAILEVLEENGFLLREYGYTTHWTKQWSIRPFSISEVFVAEKPAAKGADGPAIAYATARPESLRRIYRRLRRQGATEETNAPAA
jgi:SAM-dependent methyltransferase